MNQSSETSRMELDCQLLSTFGPLEMTYRGFLAHVELWVRGSLSWIRFLDQRSKAVSKFEVILTHKFSPHGDHLKSQFGMGQQYYPPALFFVLCSASYLSLPGVRTVPDLTNGPGEQNGSVEQKLRRIIYRNPYF